MSDAHEQPLEPGGGAETRELAPAEIAEVLANALRSAGANLLYGVPGGGANLDMIGAAEAAGCRFVLTHTETAATIMAGVTAELTGFPSASVVTRGPGAASAVNGAAQALLDRQPVVVITDCVTSADRDRVSHQRLDQASMFGAITKASLSLGSRNAAAIASKAVALTTNGRPGPVHVDVDPTSAAPEPILDKVQCPGMDIASLETARHALRKSCRPVVIVGVGALAIPQHQRLSTVESLRHFLDGTNIPVLTTYKGRGLIADSSDCVAGVATGATIEGAVLNRADLIVGIGLDPVELIPGPWLYSSPIVLLGSWEIDDSVFFGDRILAEVVGGLAQVLDELADEVKNDWATGAGWKYRGEAQRSLRDAVPPSPVGLTPQQVVTMAR